MSLLVVDGLVTVAWLLDDEDEARANEALERLKEDGATVPQLWHLEVRNSLLTAARRGRITWGEVNLRLDALNGLPIQTDEDPDLQAAMNLARRHRLSFYVALYLEVVIRQRADLATLDRAHGRAAAAEGVRTLVV